MGLGTMTKPPSVVIDANVAIAICAKEPDKFVNSVTKFGECMPMRDIAFSPRE
jgi:hypothetical protein